MQQFARALADNVDSDQRMCLSVEDQLQPSGGVAANLPACDLAIVGYAHLVGNVLFRKLFLGLADKADLRNRVDAVGIEARVREHRLVPKCTCGGDAPLFHRNGRQGREPDHVSRREYIRHLGPVVLVDRNPAAGIGLQPDVPELQLIHIALPSHCVQQRVARDLLLALQVRDHRPIRQFFD